MHSLTVYMKERLPFAQDLSLENSTDSYLCFRLAYFTVLLLFPLSITFFSFVHGFYFILFHLAQMRFFRSTCLLMCLSLETSTSIIRTGLSILVELIDMVNCYNFRQTTLLRWLTFLIKSQTVIVTVLFFWIYFSSDASICFTMALPPLGKSDHVAASVSIDFPSYSRRDAPFH